MDPHIAEQVLKIDLNAYMGALYLKTLGIIWTLCMALISFGLIITLFMHVPNL
jgi:hypothetical protein